MFIWKFDRAAILKTLYRSFSWNEAAVALRPFYFAVHPDRFPDPSVKTQNEKALQMFNGYINDAFSSNRSLQPVEVKFYITDGSKEKFREIRVQLQGADGWLLIKTALIACGLPIDNLPQFPKHNTRTKGIEDVDYGIVSGFHKKRSSYFTKKNDLKEALKKERCSAIEARRQFKRVLLAMEDDIKHLKNLLDLSEVVWTMDWALPHMRRNLIALNRLVNNASPMTLFAIKEVLRGNILRFGRGTYSCCDGGLQFGADCVPEQWQELCFQVVGDRKLISELTEIQMKLSKSLGGAHIIILDERPLVQTVYHLNQLYQRILQVEKFQQLELRKLCANTIIDVSSSYDEMFLKKDGSLNIPYTVDIKNFAQFAQKYAQQSRDARSALDHLLSETQALRENCVVKLKLEALNWQSGLNIIELKASITRLCDADNDMTALLEGLSLFFTTNPSIYVMNDGRLSLPTNWL